MTATPTFSVIVPTYRRPGLLAECLQALSLLDYPASDVEVIVVDDGGGIPLDAVLAPWAARLRLTLLRQPNAGPAAARNSGAAHATCEYLAFTDDDCRPAPNWLRGFATALATTPHALLGGRTVNALWSDPYASASQLIIEVVYAHYNARSSAAQFFASNNMAMPLEHFRAIGGFDPAFRTSEDRDLCDRWRARGYALRYVPDATISHAHRMTLRSFWGQHAGYGRGAWLYHAARARRGTGVFRPDWTFYRALWRAPFSEPSRGRAMTLWTLLMVAQFANAAGCLGQGVRHLLWSRARSGVVVRPPEAL